MPARVGAFVGVGVLGFAVQILAVMLLSKAGLSDAAATAAAVELAILHNFAWHLRWTWRDRVSGGSLSWWPQLVRFNLSAGLISIPGNVGLALWLAGSMRLPIVLANVVAVTLLSAVNYVLADRWAFTR